MWVGLLSWVVVVAVKVLIPTLSLTLKSPILLLLLSRIRKALPGTNPWAPEQVIVLIPAVASNTTEETDTEGATWSAYWLVTISGSPVVTAIEICVPEGTDAIRYRPSVTVPTPVIWTTSPTLVEIPLLVIVTPAPVPPPICEGSKSSSSALVYPEPPSVTSAAVIALPATVTLAVAPSQVVVPLLNILTLWYVPLVYPEPPVSWLNPTILPNPWGRSKVIVVIPAVVSVVIPEILLARPKSWSNLSDDSLVILFWRSLVATSPRGCLLANDSDAGGLEWLLSLSSWG